MPPSSVSGNELKPPTSATASAETVTTIVNTDRLSPALGASRMPARPAVAPPIAHVIVARKFGDHPSEDTARSFSALAEIASPIRVNRVKAHNANVSTIAMPTRIRRSSWTTTRPIAPLNPNHPCNVELWVGRNWSTWWKSLSQSLSPARPWSTISTPSVATRRTSGAAAPMKRRMPFWITTPSSAASNTATGIAAPTGQPCCSTSVKKQKNAANIAMAPCAKLTIPEPR